MDRRAMGRAAKAKGNRGERELADWMKKVTGVEWGRTPLSGAFHQSFGFDVYKKGKEATVFDLVGNENKNTKSLSVGKWIEQIRDACIDYFGWDTPRWFIRFKYKHKAYFVISEEYFEFLVGKQKEVEANDSK